jgi:hypothetical protein
MRYGNNQTAYPSQTEIARLAGVMTTPPIRVALADLISEGLIEIVRRGNGRGRATEYSVTPERGVLKRGVSKHSLSTAETLPFDRRNTPFEPPTKKNKKKTQKKNNRATTWPAVVAVLPEHMRTPELEQAWKRYEAHRAELRKPITPTQAATAAERKLKGLDDAKAAIDAIDNTIANGWTGIFRERTGGSARPDRPNSRSRAQYAEPDARLRSSRTPAP